MPTKCQEEGCTKRCVFNDECEKQALYCSIHKKDGMIDVINKTCTEPGCKTRPSYNDKGEKQALYCATHKKDKMIDVKHPTCKETGCRKIPVYNNEGETTGLYCAKHKKDGMIDVINKTCKEQGCKIQPSYNFEGETTGLYCTTHKKDGMINITIKKCQEESCKKIPNYNYEGDITALYCLSHKKENMIDIKHTFCKTQLCDTRVTNKYKGYCFNCFLHLFPDEPNARNYKTKEKATVDYIIEYFPQDKYSWIADKKIQDGCSRKRPDLLLDLGYQIIIIEVDENQHIDYDCSCENKRLMQLSQDVGHRPLVFIRFNPDEYTDKDGKITSCWSLNGLGVCTVKKSKKKEWEERLEALKKQVDYWINPDNKTEKTVEVVQLFYNCD
jgi:hypothetical protein